MQPQCFEGQRVRSDDCAAQDRAWGRCARSVFRDRRRLSQMQYNEVESWLRQWFRDRGAGAAMSAGAETDYFEAQWIDSLAVIELIEVVEQEFGVRFSETNFTDRRFST